MENNNALLKDIDIQKVADKGAKIYEKVKVKYEPKKNGKFLAIEIESGKVYLGSTSAEALMLAKKNIQISFFML